MANKVGRPKTPQDWTRAPGPSIRLTADEKYQIYQAIHDSGLKKSDWCRKALLYVANHDIRLT